MRNKSSLQISLLIIIIFLLIGNLLKTTEYKEMKRQIYECEISYENWLSFEQSRFEYMAETDERFKSLWNIQNSIDSQMWVSDRVSKLTREDYEERKRDGPGEIIAYRSIPVMGDEIKVAGFKIYTSVSDASLPSLSKLWDCRKIDPLRSQNKYEIVDDNHLLVLSRNKIIKVRDEKDEIIDAKNMRYFYQVEDLKSK